MRKRKLDADADQSIRDKFKGDPDAFFSGGEDASVGSRRRTRRRERYAARLAEGFNMLDPDSGEGAERDGSDDDID